jgi:hypothetical protein
MTRRPLVLLLLLVLLVSCDRTKIVEPDTTQAVYERLTAAGIPLGPLQPIDAPGFQTQEKAKAALPDGSTVYIYIPVRSWQPEAFLPLLEIAGGSVAYGSRWVIAAEDRPTVQKAARELGGQLR